MIVVMQILAILLSTFLFKWAGAFDFAVHFIEDKKQARYRLFFSYGLTALALTLVFLVGRL